MTWEQLVQAMKDEGFGFEIDRERYDPNDLISGTTSRAWRVQLGIVSGTVYSDADDPRTALADLLAKCREAWPPKHPWDAYTLEELEAACSARGWAIHVMDRLVDGPARSNQGAAFWAYWEPRSLPQGLGPTIRAAVLDAMKKREKGA